MSSSAKVLLAFSVIAVLAGALYPLGAYSWSARIVGRSLQGLIRSGFAVWKACFARVAWPVWLAILLSCHLVLFLSGSPTFLLVAIGGGLICCGLCSCAAFIVVDQERNEVARGYKARHNPSKGQTLAVDLVRFGEKTGLPLLLVACLAAVDGFALFNTGLYRINERWYSIGPQPHYSQQRPAATDLPPEDRDPTFADFLAYTLLNLAYAVDLLDLVNASHRERISYIHAAGGPATMSLTMFHLFFTSILLRQLFTWFRNLREVSDALRNFWSSDPVIQERAREALALEGPAVLPRVFRSLEEWPPPTSEQWQALVEIIEALGPWSIATLREHLVDQDESARRLAVAGLGRLRAMEALPVLLTLASSSSIAIRLEVLEAVSRLFAKGPSDVRKRLALARSRSSRSATAGYDPVAETVGAIRPFLRSEEAEERAAAIRFFTELGVEAAVVSPDLIALREDPASSLQVLVAQSLGAVPPDDTVVYALLDLLAVPVPEVKLAAVRSLGKAGEAAVAAAPRLIPLLQDNDQEIREAAAESLAKIGPLDERYLPRLTAGLRASDPVVRARAVEALETLGAHASSAVDRLLPLLDDPSGRVRATVARALGKIEGDPAVIIPALIAATKDVDTLVAEEATDCLALFATERAIEALIELTRHSSSRVREKAAQALAKSKSAEPAVAAALVNLLSDSKSEVKIAALAGLTSLPTSPELPTEPLHTCLSDPVPAVQASAIAALCQHECNPKRLESALLTALESPEEEVITAALQGAVALDSPNRRALFSGPMAEEELLKRIAALLPSSSAPVQIAAADALRSRGVAAAFAGEAILTAMRGAESEARCALLKAAAACQPEDAPVLWLSCLEDADLNVRLLASAGLTQVEILPEDAAETLIRVWLEPVDRLRANLATVWAKQDNIPGAAVDQLLACAFTSNDSLRLAIARALRKFPDEAKDVLERLLEDGNEEIALAAAEGVLRRDASQLRATQILKGILDTSSSPRRRRAIEILESLGPAASPFSSEMIRCLETEESEEVRSRIGTMLKSFEGEKEKDGGTL